MINSRLNHLYSLFEEAGLEAIALNPGSSLTYLTGLTFHLMERPTVLLLAPPATPAIILPELEAGKIQASAFPLQVFTYDDNPANWEVAFLRACQYAKLDAQKIGVEKHRMRVLELWYLQKSMPHASFVSAEKVLEPLRIQKDANEVAAMRQAVQIAQNGLHATLPMVKTGMTEKQIATELILNLLRAGSDPELPFNPIVSGGPNSANPHAVPSDRPLRSGDLLVIDWGAGFEGYFSDLTRTFAIGTVDPELASIAEIVKRANEAGRAAARPGIPAGWVDQATRAVINATPYGPYFIHRTGHGLGMEAHEPPYIYGENNFILPVGATFTVEPGIYLPDRGGVRIEDNMVITSTGAETLSDLPRELLTLG